MKEFKMNKLSQVMLGTIIGVSSMSAFAQTDAVVKDPSLTPTNKTRVSTELVDRVAVPGVVTQIGTVSNHPSHKKDLKGFAKDLPLITVMKQITPNGWIVKKSDADDSKVDIQKLVSWEGGKTWIETLGTVAQNYQLNALVNWDDKVITLSNASKLVPKAKKSVFELASTETIPAKVSDVAVGASELNQVEPTAAVKTVVTPVAQPAKVVAVAPVAVAPVKPVVTQKVWEISANKSLRDNVAEWAEKSGYRLVWTADDYAVVDSRVLAGEFDAENGPIKQLSDDYGPESRAQNPLSFQFYQNKTLVVENMSFEQTGFPQYNNKN
jgi:hypothetical protein